MDSFELNKIIGAILATCLVLLVTSFTAGAIFSPVMPEKPGFEIVAKEAPEGGAKEAAADRFGRKGFRRCKKMRRLPHLREGRPQPRRPQSFRDRWRPSRRRTRVQFLGGDEGQKRHLDRRRP